MNHSQKKLLEYAYWLLSRRRYTSVEILRKFKTKNSRLAIPATGPEMKTVIDYLLQKKYLDDRGYIELYLDGPARRKHLGLKKITAVLRQKGLSQSLIKTQLQQQTYDELSHARAFLQKKYPKITGHLDQKTKAKIFRQLTSRGFSSSTIFSILKKPPINSLA